jgi:hypothetical protein
MKASVGALACRPVVRVQESKASLEEARACKPEELAVLRMKASVAE